MFSTFDETKIRTMKKSILPIISFLLILSACQKNDKILNEEHATGVPTGTSYCGTPTETRFMAGKSTDVGSVTVWNDQNNVYVNYQTTGNYRLKITHLYVGLCSAIPVNNAGNPKIGHFPYVNDHGSGVSSFTRVIPRSSLPQGCLCVAAHAEVVAYNSSGSVIFSETGWGQGPQINSGGSWAMKFGYCIQACLPTGPGGDR